MRRGFSKIRLGPARLMPALLVAMATPALCRGQTDAASAKLSAWATGGASATAKPTDRDGKPGTPTAGVPYWQAPPLQQAVIQGGAIPPGWQPQPIPYQGIGPDGRVMTQYFAPTYVFTYQAGPPVLALPTGGQQPALMPAAGPVPAPAPTVARYAPQPYQFPPGSRQLSGTPLVPPAGQPPSPAAPQAWGGATPPAQPQPAAVVPPPPAPQWVPSSEPAPTGVGAAAASGAAGAGVMAAAPAAASTPPQAVAGGEQSVAAQPVSGGTASTAPPRPANSHLWRVVGVIDGDTVNCIDDANQSQRVTLAGIDAPEITQEYGKNSREALAGMVFGHTVEVVDQGRDPSGSWVGRLYVDGLDVNRQMVATGNAWQDPASSADVPLTAAQTQARGQQIGLWAQANPTPPWEYRPAGP